MEVWEKTRREAQPSQLYNETFIFRAERKRARQFRYAAVLEVYHVLESSFLRRSKTTESHHRSHVVVVIIVIRFVNFIELAFLFFPFLSSIFTKFLFLKEISYQKSTTPMPEPCPVLLLP